MPEAIPSDRFALGRVPKAGGPPIWSQVTTEVLCPLCEYNLRGAREPRCPECGYCFEWAEILDPNRRLHPYLFEQHTDGGAGRFIRTALNGLLPEHFWSSVHPGQSSNQTRLLAYWLLCAGVYVAAAALVSVPAATAEHQRIVQEFTAAHKDKEKELRDMLASPALAPQARGQRLQELRNVMLESKAGPGLSAVVNSLVGPLVRFCAPLVFMAYWMMLTFASLLIFQWSMRRARIRNVHVLRCCIYSFDGVWWLGLLLLVVGMLTLAGSASPPAGPAFWLTILPIIFGMLKLERAYEHYLRFSRPYDTVIASQIIVVLAALCTWELLDPWGMANVVYRLWRG